MLWLSPNDKALFGREYSCNEYLVHPKYLVILVCSWVGLYRRLLIIKVTTDFVSQKRKL